MKFSYLWSCQTLQDEKNFYDAGTIAFHRLYSTQLPILSYISLIFEFSSISGLNCFTVAHQIIGGFDICDEGQVKDTRGECKTAYQFSSPKEEEELKPREIKKPTSRRNLREYLRSKYRF